MNTTYADLSDAHIADMRHSLPDLFHLSLKQRLKRLLWIGLLLGVVLLAFLKMDFSLMRCWQGIAKLGWLLHFLFPPAHHGWLGVFAYALLETLAMAFLGTLLACLAAVPLGFLGAKNVLSNRSGHFLIRRAFDFMRGIDALIWALVFISVVGLGPFAGVLAIAFSDVGVLAKLFSEAIENVEKDQVEGIRSTGARSIQVMRFGIFPQIFPVLLSNALYFFESNTRSATILGVVGAGGIGLQLADRIRINNWDEVCFIVIMILITVAVIDTLSKEIRQRIIKNPEVRG